MRRVWLSALVAVGCLGFAWALGRVAWALPYWEAPKALAMPVEGLLPAQVHSQWHAVRPGGRRHEGVDLFAPKGTAVVSATRGVVWRKGWDSLGGRVVTVLGEGHTLYYYAHLDSWADGLDEGDAVRAGAALGTVGNTGNARTTPPHLHFGMYRVGLLGVTAVDPAPALRGGVAGEVTRSSPDAVALSQRK